MRVWPVKVLKDERCAPAPCQSRYPVWLALLLKALPKAMTLAWFLKSPKVVLVHY